MKLYVVDAYADRSVPRFAMYLVRSTSVANAKAAVESLLGKVERVEGEEAKEAQQGLYPDLPQDTPVHFRDFEATWIRSI